MQRHPRHPDQPQPTALHRPGFTLIELIVVILIIGILTAIILPAISNVRRTAQNARVTVDIKNLESAIANFKLKFGMEPPSSFLISSNLSDYTTSSATPLGRNSYSLMQQLWPGYTMTASNTPGTGLSGGPYFLNGAECLTFFLMGPGVYSTGGASACQPVGFSANPSNPFATGGPRVGPFYEVDASRLIDSNGNGFYELVDPLPGQTMPYQYFSSYGGRGYQLFGYGGQSNSNDNEVITMSGTPTMYSVYLKNDANGKPSNPNLIPVPGVPWNQKTFQIISPGVDGEYGIGGTFLKTGAEGISKGIATSPGDTYRDQSKRQAEVDNITNFSGGVLAKFFTPIPWQ